jgi:hypothetical protein
MPRHRFKVGDAVTAYAPGKAAMAPCGLCWSRRLGRCRCTQRSKSVSLHKCHDALGDTAIKTPSLLGDTSAWRLISCAHLCWWDREQLGSILPVLYVHFILR